MLTCSMALLFEPQPTLKTAAHTKRRAKPDVCRASPSTFRGSSPVASRTVPAFHMLATRSVYAGPTLAFDFHPPRGPSPWHHATSSGTAFRSCEAGGGKQQQHDSQSEI